MRRGVLMVMVCLLIAVFATAVFVFFSWQRELELREREHVAVARLSGTIEEAQPMFEAAITPMGVENKLERAAEDPSVRALVLRINSPGGSVSAAQQIVDIIEDFEKPVVVSMAGTAASGGYHISAPADGIVALPATTTGSIGVIMVSMNPMGLYEKLGIDIEIIQAGEHKDMSYRPFTEEEKEWLQEMMDEHHERFVQHVVYYRDLEQEFVEGIATGRIFTGTQARELGLVDKIGGIDEAVALAAEIAGLDDPQRVELPRPSLLEQLLSFALEAPTLIRKAFVPEEILLLEMAEEKFLLEPRYELENVR